MPFTLWNLLWRPGWVVRSYIEQRDPRLTKPLRMALICLAAAALLLGLTGNLSDFAAGFADGLAGQERGATATGRDAAFARAANAFLGHFNLLLVICWVPAAAAALRHSYPARQLNIAEGFVFGLYTLALTLTVHCRCHGSPGWHCRWRWCRLPASRRPPGACRAPRAMACCAPSAAQC